VKSRAGERAIPLAEDTVTVLRAYRARRNGWKLASGSDWPDTGLFFVRPDGKPWHPETISQRFDNVVAASGLPPVRFHDLRHIAATLMLAAGASIKEIQDTLGHASYTMTADIYTSVLEELKRTTAEATTKLIPRRPHRAA
jgi:integrase